MYISKQKSISEFTLFIFCQQLHLFDKIQLLHRRDLTADVLEQQAVHQ